MLVENQRIEVGSVWARFQVSQQSLDTSLRGGLGHDKFVLVVTGNVLVVRTIAVRERILHKFVEIDDWWMDYFWQYFALPVKAISSSEELSVESVQAIEVRRDLEGFRITYDRVLHVIEISKVSVIVEMSSIWTLIEASTPYLTIFPMFVATFS